MERVKRRWDQEFPEETHYSAKQLRTNASRFMKDGRGNREVQRALRSGNGDYGQRRKQVGKMK